MRGAAAGRRGVHTPREKGDGLPAVGPHGARGLSSGRPRASQRTLPGYRRAPCLGCPRGPAWVITGHHSRGVQGTSLGGGSARAPAGRGAVLRPLHMGTAWSTGSVGVCRAQGPVPAGRRLSQEEGLPGVWRATLATAQRVPASGRESGDMWARVRGGGRRCRLLSAPQMRLSCAGPGDLPGGPRPSRPSRSWPPRHSGVTA